MFTLKREVVPQVTESLFGNKENSTSETFECKFPQSPEGSAPSLSHHSINTHGSCCVVVVVVKEGMKSVMVNQVYLLTSERIVPGQGNSILRISYNS